MFLWSNKPDLNQETRFTITYNCLHLLQIFALEKHSLIEFAILHIYCNSCAPPPSFNRTEELTTQAFLLGIFNNFCK